MKVLLTQKMSKVTVYHAFKHFQWLHLAKSHKMYTHFNQFLLPTGISSTPSGYSLINGTQLTGQAHVKCAFLIPAPLGPFAPAIPDVLTWTRCQPFPAQPGPSAPTQSISFWTWPDPLLNPGAPPGSDPAAQCTAGGHRGRAERKDVRDLQHMTDQGTGPRTEDGTFFSCCSL